MIVILARGCLSAVVAADGGWLVTQRQLNVSNTPRQLVVLCIKVRYASGMMLTPGMNIRLAADQPGGGSTFVEIENDHGESIRIGKVTRHDDDTWSIRITAADIDKLPAPERCSAQTPTKLRMRCVHRVGHDSAHRADLGVGTYSWHDDV